MRKLFSVVFLVFFATCFLGACSSKDGGEFEGVLTMKTTVPASGTVDTKTFIAKEGVRSEATPNMKGMPAGVTTVALSFADTPQLVYILNEADKSYMVIDTGKALKEAAAQGFADPFKDAKIETVGKETVNGYACTHVKITSGSNVMDMWVSKDVIDSATYDRMQSASEKNTPDLTNRLRAAGADGFPVKTVIVPGNVTTELVKVEKQDVDASLFKIPEDYKKTEMPAMTGGAVSPEQKKKMEDAMKALREKARSTK